MPTSESMARRRSREVTKDRAPWGTISRRHIVDSALGMIRHQGFQQMTIRGLAAELGVSPMSLYRHITDKDDLLDDVVEELLRRSWRPPSSKEDWRTWITEAADKLRRLLVREPAALYVYQRHPVVSPTAVRRMETMLQVLQAAGLDENAAQSAYAAVHTYTLGFAGLEASRAAAPAPEDSDTLAAQLGTYTTPRQFAGGLRYLLEGIARLSPHGA
jgi:TetR/AcrR family transcriptional regulator, tetracycline repressor protein